MKDILIKYNKRESFFHNLDPISKLIWSISIIILSLIISKPLFQITLAIIIIFTVLFLTRIPFIKLSLFIYVYISFSFGFFILQLIATKGETILLSIFNITITLEALNHAVNISARMWVLIGVALIFIDSTNPQEFAISLNQKLKISYIFTFMIFIVLHFTSLFQKEFYDMQNAYYIRNANKKLSFSDKILKLKLFSSLLFFRGIRDGLNLALSMESRGFKAYKKRNYIEDIKFSNEGKIFSIIIIILTLITLFIYFI